MIFVFVFGTRWMGGWIPDAAAARGKDPTLLWGLWRGGSSMPICPIESAPAHFAGWAPLTMQSTDFYSKSRKGTARGLNAGKKIPCSHIQRRTADAAPDDRRGSAATIRSPRLGSGTCDLLCSAPQLLELFFS